MKKYINDSFKHFLHGGDYNPEQWIDDKSVWDEDMRLMKLANCNEMSVGIFSWAKLEPQENVYDFAWMDEILDKIYANGGRVFLATPSGARPRWMAKKYPEVLRVAENGQRNEFGKRHNHCYTSPYYRRKVAQMNEMLAKRYGNHPAVVGWHISNEYGGRCYCDLCVKDFQKWLKNKYKDIKTLNYQWWTTFWSHTFDSFDEVLPPLNRGDDYASLVLDWKRFCTDQTADFIRNEVQAIKKYSSLPVTTNLMHNYINLNYTRIGQEIDFVSWDSYPTWHKSENGDNVSVATEHSLAHDAYRAMKQRPFALMESTPSNTNWQEISKLKRPGMHKLSALQAVAHGSDTVQYFQWRKSRGSNEKFHGAVVDHVGDENTRVFKDVQSVGATLIKIEEVLGTMPDVKVALVMDVENAWAVAECQGYQNKNKKFYETCMQFYRDLWQRAIDVDVIDYTADFSKYKLVIAPMAYSVSEEVIEKFEKFVSKGGTLVSGYMLGSVNENDLCYLGGFPGGKLKEIFGVWAEEIDTLYPSERNSVSYNGKDYPVCDYCERIHPAKSAKVLARYNQDFYAGEPALVENAYGNGKTYYIATRDTNELKHDLLSLILSDLEIVGNIPNPQYGVSAHSRCDENVKYVFVENYNETKQTVQLGKQMQNLETGNVESVVEIEPFGVRVYKTTND